MFWTLIFLIWGLDCFLAPVSAEESQFQELYQKSEQLLMQAKPQEAMDLLLNALKDEKTVDSAGTQILALLNRLSGLFLSERTQKLYEHGKSLYFQDQIQLSRDRFKEAQALEPHNLEILASYSRALIYLDQCGEAFVKLQNGREKNPYHEDLALLFMVASLCHGRAEDFIAQLQQVAPHFKSSQSQMQAKFLRAIWLYGQGQFSQALDLAQEVIDEDPGFPEGHFWVWRSAQQIEGSQQALQAGRRYISLCKGVSSRLRRRYENQPSLCQSVKKVELYFEKLERDR